MIAFARSLILAGKAERAAQRPRLFLDLYHPNQPFQEGPGTWMSSNTLPLLRYLLSM